MVNNKNKLWLVLLVLTICSVSVFAAVPTIDSVILNATSSLNTTADNLTGFVAATDIEGDNIRRIDTIHYDSLNPMPFT